MLTYLISLTFSLFQVYDSYPFVSIECILLENVLRSASGSSVRDLKLTSSPHITLISSFLHMSEPSQPSLLIFTETSVLTPNLLASFPLRTLLTTDTSAKYPSMRPLQLCGFSSCFFFMLPISTPHPRTEQHVMCHSPLFFNGMYIL